MLGSRRLAGTFFVVLVAGAGCCKQGNTTGDDPSNEPSSSPTVVQTQPSKATTLPAGKMPATTSIVFLHHSTGENIWNGGVESALEAHNVSAGTSYRIRELAYPHDPYPWDNYPYDYWNLWVKHAGPSPFQGQETLEMLTAQYQVVVFKHCYPVSAVEAGSGPGDAASSDKTLANYKLQYAALKAKLRTFASTRFVVWTGAALTMASMRNDYGGNDQTADRANEFAAWVKQQWDEPGDNIFVFDFRQAETGGDRYMSVFNAVGPGDSHPNEAFSRKVAPLFARRVIDVIEGRGDTGSLTGQ